MGLFDRLANYIVSVIEDGTNSRNALKSTDDNRVSSPSIHSEIETKGARHRIDEQKIITAKTGERFFTSDLSVNEHLLTREAGYEPIGLVMGSSFYKVGFYGYFRGYRRETGEVDVLTNAQLAVRELAIGRMQKEAAMLGADGIIGVRLHQRRKGWGVGMIELTAIGTAIRLPHRPPNGLPFTSDLSGQEFWQLLQAGYYPKGLVFGACSYYVHSDRRTRALMNPNTWTRLFGRARLNQELVQYTEGFQDARELAVMRLTRDIERSGADGAVGMQIEKSEEAIVYQLNPLGNFIVMVWILGFLSAFFLSVFGRGDSIFGLVITFLPVIIIVIPVMNLIASIYNGSNSGTFRDLLTNFVVMGTAIVKDETRQRQPMAKPLTFIPLNKK